MYTLKAHKSFPLSPVSQKITLVACKRTKELSKFPNIMCKELSKYPNIMCIM